MLRVDFHTHTVFSKDSLTRPEALLKTCRRKKIGRVVITDHNTIQGALQAQQIDPERVIEGEEIMTTGGEILAIFVNEEVPAGLPPLEAIQRLRSQGAFISLSHPFDRWRKGGWQKAPLEQVAGLVDAIEIFNARCMLPEFNHLAQAFAQERQLPGTAGSDAHCTWELGQATLWLDEFHNPAELTTALKTARPDFHRSAPLIHFTSRYARWVKKLQKALK